MSIDKLESLEKQFAEMQKLFFRLEATLENIEKNISQAITIKDTVTTHIEKFRITEKRLYELEKNIKSSDEKINNINLKIALVAGGWGVLFFVIQVVISKI
jgi:predicted RNase H-like nuclease (RuvC/YqgF family)